MVGVGLTVALLPGRVIGLSGSVSGVGLLASIFAIPNILLQIPVGRLSDRFGFKGFLISGYLLCALSGVVFFTSGSLSLFLLGRFVQGAAEVPVWALGPAYLSLRRPGRKGRFMGMYSACLHAGLMAGGLLSMLPAASRAGNRAFLVFTAAGLLGALVLSAFFKNPESKIPSETSMEATGTTSLLRDPAVRAVLPGVVLYGVGYGCFITIVPAFLNAERGMNQTMVGLFFTLFYVALSLSQLWAGPISDRRGRKPAMALGLCAAGVGIAAFPQCSGPWGIGALFAASLGLGIFCVAALAFLNEQAPDAMKGAASGVFFFCWGAGYFLGPMAVGALGSRFTYPAAFSAMAGAFGLAVAVIAFFVPKKKRAECLPAEYRQRMDPEME